MDFLYNAGILVTIVLVLVATGFLEAHAWVTAGVCLSAAVGAGAFLLYRRYMKRLRAVRITGFHELDPDILYERVAIQRERDAEKPTVTFRQLGGKKTYIITTSSTVTKYFFVTSDGGLIPYLYVPLEMGGRRNIGPAKIYTFTKRPKRIGG